MTAEMWWVTTTRSTTLNTTARYRQADRGIRPAWSSRFGGAISLRGYSEGPECGYFTCPSIWMKVTAIWVFSLGVDRLPPLFETFESVPILTYGSNHRLAPIGYTKGPVGHFFGGWNDPTVAITASISETITQEGIRLASSAAKTRVIGGVKDERRKLFELHSGVIRADPTRFTLIRRAPLISTVRVELVIQLQDGGLDFGGNDDEHYIVYVPQWCLTPAA